VAPAETVVRFEPRGAVLALFKSRADEVLLSGAGGTGKTVGALMKIHLAMLQTPGARALLVRKTHNSLTASTLVTFRQKVAAEAIAAGIVRWYGGSGSEPAAFRYSNGSTVVVGGLDKPSRLLSTEYDLCFVDEAIETTSEDLDTIITRLRHGRMSYQQLILCTNPGAPTHHLKQRVDAGRTQIFYSQHEDNPRMYAAGQWTEYGLTYLTRLDSLTGVRKQRMRFGKWCAAEGLVYEDFDPAVHIIDALPKGSEDWPRWHGLDFGYTHAFVWQAHAVDPDGRMYLTHEIHMTGRLVEDHAAQIKRVVQKPDGTWREPRPRSIVADHNAEDRATFEKHFGMSTTAAHKAISPGIQAMQARLRPAGDGRPRFYVLRDSLVEVDQTLVEAKKPTCLVDELTSYAWPQDVKPAARENPVKEDDDSCDTARYVCAELDLGGRPGVRVLG
jgi:PBSX family phage terminase large subunit